MYARIISVGFKKVRFAKMAEFGLRPRTVLRRLGARILVPQAGGRQETYRSNFRGLHRRLRRMRSRPDSDRLLARRRVDPVVDRLFLHQEENVPRQTFLRLLDERVPAVVSAA